VSQFDSMTTVLAVVAAFLAAAVAVRILRALLTRVLGGMEMVSAENRAAIQKRAQGLVRAVTLMAFAVAGIAALSLALDRFGVSEPHWKPQQLLQWTLTHGINIVIIVIGAAIVMRAANLAIEHLQHKLGKRHQQTDLEWQRRASTLSGILTSTVTVAVGLVAVMMLLRELSIDVLPLLTGAGIAGLAIGFGAQNLVRDVISGFFLILEDQIRIGDLARINGVSGIIEQINLRTIVLRDDIGAVQVFPNGTITALANLSKQFANAIVDVRVAYQENIDRVIGTLREVGTGMEQDQTWGSLVLDRLNIPGVVSIAEGWTTIRVKFRTLPLNQDAVANELRRRIVAMFVKRGIRPYGQA
jgi:small conductance mechanosensitive channel